jgi:hypothetical protein
MAIRAGLSRSLRAGSLTLQAFIFQQELERFLLEDIKEPNDPEKKKWLKCRRFIMVHHGHIIEDNTAILIVLSAIEYVDASWVHLFEHDFNSGNLYWSKLTALCMAKGNTQLTRAAYAANTAESTGQGDPQPQGQT